MRFRPAATHLKWLAGARTLCPSLSRLPRGVWHVSGTEAEATASCCTGDGQNLDGRGDPVRRIPGVCSREPHESCKADGVTYVVTVDDRIADGAPEMDELQRVGAITRLEQGFDAVEEIAGPVS